MTNPVKRHVRFRLKVLIALYAEKTRSKLTYQDLSDATGISTNTITRLANNKLSRVALNTLEQLCDFFSCELSDLARLAEDGEEE